MPEEFKHIVRIAGKDLQGERQVQLALAGLKGVSLAYARAVTFVAKVNPFAKLGEIGDSEIKQLETILKNPIEHGIPLWMLNRRKDVETGKDLHLVGPNVDIAVRTDIKKERQIRSRRGIRHELGLPVRGQRTRTTGRKGLTVGVKRKDIRIREEAAKATKGKSEEKTKGKSEEKAKGKSEES